MRPPWERRRCQTQAPHATHARSPPLSPPAHLRLRRVEREAAAPGRVVLGVLGLVAVCGAVPLHRHHLQAKETDWWHNRHNWTTRPQSCSAALWRADRADLPAATCKATRATPRGVLCCAVLPWHRHQRRRAPLPPAAGSAASSCPPPPRRRPPPRPPAHPRRRRRPLPPPPPPRRRPPPPGRCPTRCCPPAPPRAWRAADPAPPAQSRRPPRPPPAHTPTCIGDDECFRLEQQGRQAAQEQAWAALWQACMPLAHLVKEALGAEEERRAQRLDGGAHGGHGRRRRAARQLRRDALRLRGRSGAPVRGGVFRHRPA